MKTICFYFEIHQIFHLKRYRFFDIGTEHYYYDEYINETKISDVVERSYKPAIKTLIEMVKNTNGAFKVALGISGVALEQLEMRAPCVIDLLKELANTGGCEFVSETYTNGLSSLIDEVCFRNEVTRQSQKIKQLFGVQPSVFRNTGMVYSDEIGSIIADMGFKGILTEGAKHILGWKSPHYVYHSEQNPELKILFRDFKLSDDISLRFSNHEWNEYPLYADKYIGWIDSMPKEEKVINIYMPLDALGVYQPLSSNILEFFKAIPACAAEKGITFSTPSEIIAKSKSISPIEVLYPISCIDEERDISAWLGNVLQREAFNKLFSVSEKVRLCNDKRVKQDWDYLQACDNFRYMSTKHTGLKIDRGIYDSPYDAFSNYMNILADFINRVNALFPEDVENEELNSLLTTIKNQGKEIEALHKKIDILETKAANGELKKKKEKAEKSATTKSKATKATEK